MALTTYDLILVDRHRDSLQDTAAAITDNTRRSVEVLAADLALPDDLARVENALRQDASITLLVNAAGAIDHDSNPDEVGRMIALRVTASARLAYALAPGFAARGTGTIINVESEARKSQTLH